MKTKLGLAILSTACIGLAGCMGVDQDAEKDRQSANLKFIRESSAPIAAQVSAEFPTDPEALNEIIAENLRKIGCPKLANLFGDLLKYDGQGSFPASFTEYLSCYGLSAVPTPEEIEGIKAKFENPLELLECICGGDGLNQLLAGKIEIFSAQASAAAQVFSASGTGTGEKFDASKSKAADVYSSN